MSIIIPNVKIANYVVLIGFSIITLVSTMLKETVVLAVFELNEFDFERFNKNLF